MASIFQKFGNGAISFSPEFRAWCYYAMTGVLPILFLGVLVFRGLQWPLTQRERGRMLLDLVESALAHGRSVEQAIVNLSLEGEKSMGTYLHMLAAEIAKGRSFVSALERVPGMLPPQVIAMLRVGEALGDISRVIPACRSTFEDAVSKSRGTLNYQLVLAIMIHPAILVVPVFFMTKILPVMQSISGGIGQQLPSIVVWVLRWGWLVSVIQITMIVVVYFLVSRMFGTLPSSDLFEKRFPRISAWGAHFLGWRRLRAQRNFARLLGMLLDAGVPEDRALCMAGAGTGSPILQERAEKAARAVSQGVKLTEAVAVVDDSGHFRWRLENAVHGGRRCGFGVALAGWCEMLNATAFQKEQAAAQMGSLVLLLLNAASMALIAITVFTFISRLSLQSCF